MKTKKRVLPALLLSVFAGISAPAAEASQFSNVYVFGDSLSDAGYFRPFLAGVGVPANLVAIMGSFTTNPSPVWSELISTHYGVAPNPSNVSGGNIFAQGGARVTGTPGVSTPPGMAERPVATQINEFLARGPVDSGALYAVWAGANDVFFNLGLFSAGAITQAQLQTNVVGAATAEIAQIARLRDAGARYIMVVTLPNIGATPAFAGGATASAVTQLSAGYNTTLLTGLQGAGIRVIPIDSFSFFNEVLANAGAFGFTNTTSMACGPFPPITTAANVTSLFCYTGNLTAPGADRTHLFADSVHPTGGSHALFAQFVESIVDGPSQHGLLAESALRARESHIRSLADGVALGRKEAVGKYSVFFGGDKSNFELATTPALDSSPSAGTIGVTLRASESVMIGGAYGSARNHGTFGNNAGDFNTSENVWSIFASLRAGGFYGTAVASLADIRYGDIRRHIPLGPQIRVAQSSTEGSNASFHITTGYDFNIGRFAIGPTLAVTTQHVDVRGFDEAGAGSANLRIHDQKLKSEVWSFGARASYDFGNWTPWVRVTADEERKDDVRLVSATPITLLAVGSTYDVPAYKLDSSYITASVGLNGSITPNIGLSVAYYYVDSRGGVKQDGLYGLVSFRF